MAPRWRGWLRVATRLGLLAAAIALFVHFADLHAVGDALKAMTLPVFALALVCDSGFYIVESWRLEMLSLRRYRFGLLWRARMITALLANVLPGMISGEVLRILFIDRARPGNKLYVGLLLLANRLYGLLALASLFLIAFAVDGDRLPHIIARHRVLLTVVCVTVPMTPLALRVRAARVAMVALIRRLRGRLRRIAYTVFSATSHFCDVRRWALAVITSTISNALVVVQFWLVGRAIGAGLTLTEWAICVPLAAIASFLPIGFGSIGPQDATFVVVGRLTGHSIERLLAVSVLMHVIQVAGTLPGLLFVSDIKLLVAEAFAAGRSVADRRRGRRGESP